MSKRKSNDALLPSAKRPAVSRVEQQFPDVSSTINNAFESWQQCVALDDSATTTKDYKSIVQCSTSALDNLHNTVILALLDIRAKAYLKQQEYKQAEIDASEMIKLAPRSPKGYIRRAEVYIHQDNFDGALDIYKQGRELSDLKMLDQKIHDLQDILDDKITAYVNECKFSQAERFARHWMRLYPFDLRSYTRAGDVYMMQGKSLLAVQAYAKGGLINQDMDQAASDALMAKFHQAWVQSVKCIDIIAQSPFDIVASILPYLSTTSLLECLRVSKTWRTKTTQCRSAWRTVVVPQDEKWLTELTHARYHRDHVQKLRINRPEFSYSEFNSTWLTMCSMFKHLETLVIEIYALDINTLINGLEATRSTLRQLEIVQEDKFWQLNGAIDHFGPIWATLSGFQQLTHYLFRDVSVSSDGFQESTLPSIPNLTHLGIVTHWLSDRDEASTRRFDIILKACPNLTYIRTNSQNSGLGVIHRRLRKPVYLSLSTQDKILDYQEDFLNQHYKPSNGIRILKIYSENFPDANTTFTVLHANRHTLEELQLWEVCNPFVPDDDMQLQIQDDRVRWNVLSKFGSTVLRKFDCGLDRLTQRTVLSILHLCPNLETVYFTSSTQLTDDVFDALIRLRRLTKLELRDCKKITGDGLAMFFVSMRTRLKHLHLADMAQDLSDAYFHPLARVQLTTLYLNGFSDGGPLATIVSNMSSLEEIALRGIKIRIHSAFEDLARLPKLRKVELMELDSVMDDDIVTLVNKSNSIQNISVAYCDTITSDSIAYANRYISATLFLREDEE